MLPEQIRNQIESLVGSPVLRHEPVLGGCIANAEKVVAANQNYFVKWATAPASQTFVPEARGLEELRKAANIVRIPHVIGTELRDDGSGILILEWVETAPFSRTVWERFGEGLAEIHRFTGTRFGFDIGNYIGATPQNNDLSADWISFFRDRRVLFQVDLARRSGVWKSKWDSKLTRMLNRLSELLPEKPAASLVHGDLWQGNLLSDERGNPVLIDPAVYYGHREVDLAMLGLFSSPPTTLMDAYDAVYPPQYGRDARRDVYNLYHLINHLNLFGGGYASSVARILDRF